MRRIVNAAVCLAAVLPAPAMAEGLASARTYQVVERQGKVEMDHLFSIDPVCHPAGAATVSLLVAPKGGSVKTSVERRLPASAPRESVGARCQTRRMPATVVYYVLRPDFVGTDWFDVKVVYPDGFAQERRYNLTVR